MSPELTILLELDCSNFHVIVNKVINNNSKFINCPETVDVGIGAWGRSSSNTVPTGFCSDCLIGNIRNKSYSYSNNRNSVELVTQRTKIEGHDIQRCLLVSKMRLEFDLSQSLLQQLPPQELQQQHRDGDHHAAEVMVVQ